jgi:hypothetical protein
MNLLHRLVLTAVLVLFAVACVYAIPKGTEDSSAAATDGKAGAAKPAADAKGAAADSKTTKDPVAERAAKAEAYKKVQDTVRVKRTLAVQRTSLTVEHQSVKDVLAMLAEKGKFSVVFDPELETGGIDLSTRLVDMKFAGMKYEDAIQLVLPHECGYRVGPGYILVTTLEKSWLPLRTSIYSIHMALAEIPDFGGQAPRIEIATVTQQAAAAAGGGGQFGNLFNNQQAKAEISGAVTPDRIIEIIKKFVRNDNDRRIAPWDDDGGPASITSLHGNLIVSQTDQGHRAVAEILSNLF